MKVLVQKTITPQILDMDIHEDYQYLLTGQPKLPPIKRQQSKDGLKKARAAQGRARARRIREKELLSGYRKIGDPQSPEALEAYLDGHKPIELWDIEELARGMPRNKSGRFNKLQPEWVTSAIHEDILRRFQKLVRGEMNKNTVLALETLKRVMDDKRTDTKGRDIVPANTKLTAATFLIEHVVGKPKQRMEADISIRLQAMLGTSMVNPTTEAGVMALTQGYIDADAWEDDDDLEPNGE